MATSETFAFKTSRMKPFGYQDIHFYQLSSKLNDLKKNNLLTMNYNTNDR